MSGLALTAFILSLLAGVGAILSGLWWLAAICAVLSMWGISAAVPTQFRGRGFAIAGLVISLLLGSCAFMFQRAMLSAPGMVIDPILRAADATTLTDAERRDQIFPWFTAEAQAAGEYERFLERFAAARAAYGAYADKVETGTLFSSYLQLVSPPDAEAVEEIAPPGTQDLLVIGRALWTRAQFEKGQVYVALEWDQQLNQDELKEQVQEAGGQNNELRPFPIARAIRLFRPK